MMKVKIIDEVQILQIQNELAEFSSNLFCFLNYFRPLNHLVLALTFHQVNRYGI